MWGDSVIQSVLNTILDSFTIVLPRRSIGKRVWLLKIAPRSLHACRDSCRHCLKHLSIDYGTMHACTLHQLQALSARLDLTTYSDSSQSQKLDCGKSTDGTLFPITRRSWQQTISRLVSRPNLGFVHHVI